MQSILLLTDMPTRGHRLISELGRVGETLMVDLLDPDQEHAEPDVSRVRAVISDVSLARSRQIAGLKRHLGRFGSKRPPFLWLLHEDSPRARAQALALGATQTLRGDRAADMLAQAISCMTSPQALERQAAVEDAAKAELVLARMFALGRSGGIIDPKLIAAGAEFIEAALQRADVRAWLDIVWKFDDATHQHCLLVAGLAAGFARQLGLGHRDCQELTQAALLHDVGKSRVPLGVLNKPGALDPREMAVMRRHPALGFDMLIGQGYPDAMLAVVRSHHEALDGSGYPDGLHGSEIPDLVRLVTVCDIFGALIERRPYRKPMGGDQAYTLLRCMAGKIDQDLVRAFQPLAEAAGTAILEPST